MSMGKIYSLLRNNQQLGPFSLEELVQLSLKPMDLVWIEGKSAGWRYPSEIESLKEYTQNNSSSEPIVQEQRHSSYAPEEPVNASRHIFVSLPSGSGLVRNEPSAKKTTATGNEASLPESFDERVERMRRKVASLDQKENAIPEEGVSTKYSRSLDDIKQEYSSWLYQQKNKQRLKPSRKQIVMLAGAVCLFFAGILTYHWTQEPRTVVLPETYKQGLTSGQPDLPPGDQKKINKEKEATPRSLSAKKSRAVNPLLKKAPEKSVGSVPEKPVMVAARKKASGAEADMPAGKKEEEIQQEKAGKSIPLIQLLDLQAAMLPARKGIGGAELILRNKSDQLLKVVAVDIIYKKGSEEIHRETIYFSNVAPGGSQTLKAPAHKKANWLEYRYGLISSAEGGLYVAK